MMHQICHRFFTTLSLLLFFQLAVQAQFPGPPGGTYDRVAVASSTILHWNNPAAWGGASVPSTNHRVLIPAGVTVAISNVNLAEVKFVRVEGNLRFVAWANTRLTAETVFIAPGGKLLIGSAARPVNANRTAEIVFSNNGAAFDTNWDPREQSRGLVSKGTVIVHGAVKQHMVECDNSIFNGLTSINLNLPAPTNWRSNDELAIAGSQFKRGATHSDEVVRFASASGNQLFLQSSTPTQKQHLRVDVNMNLHIANLTRNVIFRSESASPLKARGHVMFAPGGTADIRYVTFQNLGRTDKTRPLNERVITVTGQGTGQFTNVPGDSTNRRGRYACHFHINGPGANVNQPTSTVYGCVVRNTPGWGFVNHSSNVLFEKNVCYDFNGAGFVTEAGDELGSFINNIAMHGVGQDRNGDGIAERYYRDRHVFMNAERDQPLGDFAFGGEGFWFQGPAVRAVDNVATNCSGAGMIWFTTGSPEVYSGKYVCFPAGWINQVYSNTTGLVYRTNSQAYPGGNGGNVVISDLPILQMNGLDAYGCLIGFKLRFNNHGAVAWYNEGPFDFHLSFIGGASKLRQKIDNLRLWNNERGFKGRYTSNTDWNFVQAINKLRFSNITEAYVGAELNHNVVSHTLKNLTVSGYGICTFIKPPFPATATPPTFLAPTTRRKYANLEYGNVSAACPITNVLNPSNLQPTQATINWMNQAAHTRYLIRFQKTSAIKWSLTEKGGSASNVTLTNLSPGTTYRYQVLGGCGTSIQRWSAEKTFTTPTNKAATQLLQKDLVAGISLYPNPISEGRLRLEVPEMLRIEGLKIYDLQGKLLLQLAVEQALTKGIALDALPGQGMFILEVATPEGLKALRFVKQ